eukprot:290833_1
MKIFNNAIHWLKRIGYASIAYSICPVELQNINATRDQFSSDDEMKEFFDCLNNCHHNQAEMLYVNKSVSAYSNWMSRMYFLRSQSEQEKCREMQSGMKDICKSYGEEMMSGSQIDDFYWQYYKTLQIPNKSMNCAIFGVDRFVEFVLKEFEAQLKNENHVEKFNVLDIGCGTGLVGAGLARSLQKHELDKCFDVCVNGFDRSEIALEYGNDEKYWNYLCLYDNIWQQDLFDRNINEKQYDIVFASDILYQLPVCGTVGVNAIKRAFEFVKSGGYLVVMNPIQSSTPCIQESYQTVLEEFYKENYIIYVLDQIVDTIDHDKDYQRLDAVYVHIRIMYKGEDKSVFEDYFPQVERPCVNLMK